METKEKTNLDINIRLVVASHFLIMEKQKEIFNVGQNFVPNPKL